MRIVIVTSLTLLAFAANSILCRLALGGNLIDPVGSGAIFREKADWAYFNFSLRGKHCFPYLQDHGPWTGDLR